MSRFDVCCAPAVCLGDCTEPIPRKDNRSRDDPTNVLAACKDDIVLLWGDPVVRDVLTRHNVRLEDSPGL